MKKKYIFIKDMTIGTNQFQRHYEANEVVEVEFSTSESGRFCIFKVVDLHGEIHLLALDLLMLKQHIKDKYLMQF